jgi:hypothetical protein
MHKPFFLWLWWSVLQCIQHKVLEQLLVADPHFHWLSRWAVFPVPRLHKRHVDCPASPAYTEHNTASQTGNLSVGVFVCNAHLTVLTEDTDHEEHVQTWQYTSWLILSLFHFNIYLLFQCVGGGKQQDKYIKRMVQKFR